MDLMMVTGEPGVGKSTLVEELTRGVRVETLDEPFEYRHYPDAGVTEIGIRREGFPGTDAYAMNIQPQVLAFLSNKRPSLVLVEGDRLANGKFLGWCRDVLGYKLWLYNLYGYDVAEQRRASRGHVFDESWLKGRQTKVEKLAYTWNAIALDADATPAELVERIENPVAAALKAARGVAV